MVEFCVDGPIAPGDVPALVLRLSALLEHSGTEVVVCRLRDVCASVVSLEALARLQLAAVRHGCRLTLSGASRELRELVEFAGMRDVLAL
jgi:ABC-type transporter Mla MlaB component